MEHENEIIRWFCGLKSSSFPFPFSCFTLCALTFSFWVKETESKGVKPEIYTGWYSFNLIQSWNLSVHLQYIRYGYPKPAQPHLLLPSTLTVSPFLSPWFPRTHSYSSYSWFWPQHTSAKCCNITTEGRGVVRRWTHRHTHTHIHTLTHSILSSCSTGWIQMFFTISFICDALQLCSSVPLPPRTIIHTCTCTHRYISSAFETLWRRNIHLEWPPDSNRNTTAVQSIHSLTHTQK